MLKKISTSQLGHGMYVHQLVGSWLDHPFWKKSFLLTERKQLDLIRRSPVREVWIDTARGGDVPVVVEEPVDDSALATMIMSALVPDDEPVDDRATSLADELERAGRIVNSARGAMRRMFADARLGKAIDSRHCLPLVDEITQSVDRNPGAIVSLARLKTSDDYTYMHSVAVCALMVSLARQLGLPDATTREAGLAGLVHDVGKAKMPTEILNKPGPLTAAEFGVMRGHPQAGYEMLREAHGVSEGVMDVCLHHHEKMDGSGYPSGLAAGEISLLARMGAVCDVYDAITSNRPYKAGWDPAISIQKMAQWSRDGHFDDAIMQGFIRSVGIYPIGSLVRLSSGLVAVVVDQTPGNLLVPVVQPILDPVTRTRCEGPRIDLTDPTTEERIVSRESADTWGLTAVDDVWCGRPVAAPTT